MMSERAGLERHAMVCSGFKGWLASYLLKLAGAAVGQLGWELGSWGWGWAAGVGVGQLGLGFL